MHTRLFTLNIHTHAHLRWFALFEGWNVPRTCKIYSEYSFWAYSGCACFWLHLVVFQALLNLIKASLPPLFLSSLLLSPLYLVMLCKTTCNIIFIPGMAARWTTCTSVGVSSKWESRITHNPLRLCMYEHTVLKQAIIKVMWNIAEGLNKDRDDLFLGTVSFQVLMMSLIQSIHTA